MIIPEWRAFLQHWRKNFSIGFLHIRWNGMMWKVSSSDMYLLITIRKEFIHLIQGDILLLYIDSCKSCLFLQHRNAKNLVSLYGYTFLDNSKSYVRNRLIIFRISVTMVSEFTETHKEIKIKIYRKPQKWLIAVKLLVILRLRWIGSTWYTDRSNLIPKVECRQRLLFLYII